MMEGSVTRSREYNPEIKVEYGSGSRRLIAILIDALILNTITSPIRTHLHESFFAGKNAFMLQMALGSIVYGYSIIGHGLWGQTIGKKCLSLKVIDKSENKPIGFKQALLRDIIPIFLWLSIYVVGVARYNLDLEVFRRATFYLNSFSIIKSVWPLIEIVTMVTNKRRRAFHDLVAGTVVVRV